MSSGDFWCMEHLTWNCTCSLPPAALTTSGGAMARPRSEEREGFRLIEYAATVLQLGEGGYVTRDDDVVTVRNRDGKPVVQMEYETWKRIGGKEIAQ